MDMIWKNIKQIAENNNGYIMTSQVEDAGISRPMLKKYRDNGYLHMVRKGLYIMDGEIIDEYRLLQAQRKDIVFSYGTALYLWGLTDRIPHYIDVTLPRGANCTRLKKDNPEIRFHYVSKEVYGLGITETLSPQGNTVKVYDKERCICDIVRDRGKMDKQIFTQAIKEYFNTKPNLRKLIKYSKNFGIEDTIRIYTEVL